MEERERPADFGDVALFGPDLGRWQSGGLDGLWQLWPICRYGQGPRHRAACGNAGGTAPRKLAIRITDRYGVDQRAGQFPARVSALDENFILMEKPVTTNKLLSTLRQVLEGKLVKGVC